MSKSNKVVTRFAPSPTGLFHIGGARTALFNYLFAKKHGGTYILRIEDTDKERSKPEYEENVLASLAWLGITHDALYRQSERTEIYKKYLKQLVDSGKAYISEETPTEAGERDSVIRFRNPGVRVSFDDLILGKIEVDTTDLGDFVIAKDLETPLYHLAVVVDDHEMGVTHVIRAQEHISNTPRQLLLIEAIGAIRPQYGHIPIVLAPDHTKLSKRHGAVSVFAYRDEGYLPEALVNFIALLGWSPQSARGSDAGDVLPMNEIIELFDLAAIQKSGAVFDIKKLQWMNKQYLKKLSPAEARAAVRARLVKHAPADEQLAELAPLLLDRVHTLHEITELEQAGELDYFFERPSYDRALLLGKKGEYDPARVRTHLAHLLDGSLAETDVRTYADTEGRGEVFWPLRVALTGRERSTEPFAIMRVVGEDEARKRLQQALKLLA